jgi:hypothetical protein
MNTSILVLPLIFFLPASDPSAQAGPLDLVVASQQQNFAAIRTYYVKLEYSFHETIKKSYNGPLGLERWQTPNAMRARIKSQMGTTEALEAGGRMKVLSRYPRPAGKEFDSGGYGPSDATDFFTPWTVALMTDERNPPNVVAARINRNAKAFKVEKEDATGLYRVDWTAPAGKGASTNTYWFDPKHGYLVVKFVCKSDLPQFNNTSEVVGFQEPKPGIFVPKKMVSKRHGYDVTCDFVRVIVNEPIDESIFQLTFPEGTAVADRSAGTSYVTGKDEKPNGPVGSLADVKVREAPTQFPTGDPRAESLLQRNWQIIGAGVGGVLAVAGVAIWLWRRRSSAT